MRKHINLLQKEEVSAYTRGLIHRYNVYGVVAGSVLFSFLLILTFLEVSHELQLKNLIQRQKDLIETSTDDRRMQSKTVFLAQKENQLKTFMKDDAQFLPYYNLLKNILQPTEGTAPIIESMTIDKNKTTNFIVRFNDYQPAYLFMKYIESDDFLKNFTSLTLDHFSVIQDNLVENKGFELQFEGAFKPINEHS